MTDIFDFDLSELSTADLKLLLKNVTQERKNRIDEAQTCFSKAQKKVSEGLVEMINIVEKCGLDSDSIILYEYDLNFLRSQICNLKLAEDFFEKDDNNFHSGE